jgi:hypothetical protein
MEGRGKAETACSKATADKGLARRSFSEGGKAEVGRGKKGGSGFPAAIINARGYSHGRRAIGSTGKRFLLRYLVAEYPEACIALELLRDSQR